VRQLLPNHYLNLATFESVRFAPGAIAKMPLDKAVQTMSALLRGTIEAVTYRGSVAIPLTAGFDSRTLVSAAVGLPVRYFTIVDEGSPHHDLAIPPKIAGRLDLEWSYVGCNLSDSAENVTGGIWHDPAVNQTNSFAQAEFVVLGQVSEICRCFYWLDGHHAPATPELMSRMARFGDQAIEQFREWMVGIPDTVDPFDLFYWEHRVGCWASLSCTEMDPLCDVISPYNCRELLNAGLGVDIRYRRRPHELHRQLCLPELRSIPFNSTWFERAERMLPRWFPLRVRKAMDRWVRSRTRRANTAPIPAPSPAIPAEEVKS
jgi:hypothetical protein